MGKKSSTWLLKIGFVCIFVGFLGLSFLLILTQLFNAWGTVVWQVWAMITFFITLFAIGLRIWLERWKAEMGRVLWPLRAASILFMVLGLLSLLGLAFIAGTFIMVSFLMSGVGMYPDAFPLYMIAIVPFVLTVVYFHASLHVKDADKGKGVILYLFSCLLGSLIGIWVALSLRFLFLPIIYVGVNIASITLIIIGLSQNLHERGLA